jgi:hypothetical protein
MAKDRRAIAIQMLILDDAGLFRVRSGMRRMSAPSSSIMSNANRMASGLTLRPNLKPIEDRPAFLVDITTSPSITQDR